MTASDFVAKVIAYYPGNYSDERSSQLAYFARNISEQNLDTVYRNILEERQQSTAITVQDIKAACQRAGVPFRPMADCSRIEDWHCACCGEEFKYVQFPTDDQRLDPSRPLHDRCPNCGFMVEWTKTATAYESHGCHCEWYTEYLVKFGGPNGYGYGKAKGRWFQRSKFKVIASSDEIRELDEKTRKLREACYVKP